MIHGANVDALTALSSRRSSTTDIVIIIISSSSDGSNDRISRSGSTNAVE